jgi:hypothetical protein
MTHNYGIQTPAALDGLEFVCPVDGVAVLLTSTNFSAVVSRDPQLTFAGFVGPSDYGTNYSIVGYVGQETQAVIPEIEVRNGESLYLSCDGASTFILSINEVAEK